MKDIELVGGPLDGAHAEEIGLISEGQNIFVQGEDGTEIVYTLHNGLLEYNSHLTYGT